MGLDSSDPTARKALEAAERRAARKGTRQEFSARRKAGKAAGQRQRLQLLAQRQSEAAPVRRRIAWTPAEDALLAELAATLTPNRVIAARLGRRSVATVATRRSQRGLTQRPERCQRCGASITQPARGRPRRYCGPDCTDQATRERASAAREARRAALIAARGTRVCAAPGCENPLPVDHVAQRRFCSRPCRVRAYETGGYGAVRAEKQKQRAAAAAAVRSPRTPRPTPTVAVVVALMDWAGQPDDFCGIEARAWVRHVVGLPTASEVLSAAIRERKARHETAKDRT